MEIRSGASFSGLGRLPVRARSRCARVVCAADERVSRGRCRCSCLHPTGWVSMVGAPRPPGPRSVPPAPAADRLNPQKKRYPHARSRFGHCCRPGAARVERRPVHRGVGLARPSLRHAAAAHRHAHRRFRHLGAGDVRQRPGLVPGQPGHRPGQRLRLEHHQHRPDPRPHRRDQPGGSALAGAAPGAADPHPGERAGGSGTGTCPAPMRWCCSPCLPA